MVNALPLLLLALAASPSHGRAVASDPPASADDERERELEELRARLERLEARERGDAWSELLELSLYGAVLGRRDDKRVLDEEGNQVDDRILVPQLGLDLRAPLGEGAEVVLFLTLDAEPVNDFEADAEEAYVVLAGVPLLPAWTRALRLRGGRFRSSFGRTNEWRRHELPLVTRSLPAETFLGRDGFVQSGFSVTWRAPLPPGHGLSLTYEGLDNGDLPVTETSGDEPFADLVDLDWRLPVGADELVLGSSFWEGKQSGEFSRRSRLLGLDALFRHEPRGPEQPGAFRLGGEWIDAEIERVGAPDDEPSGWSLWGQLSVAPRWLAGARWGRAEDVADDTLETERLGLFATYLHGESLRFALGWQHSWSDAPQRDGADAILFDVSFALGRGEPHLPRPVGR